eukprot:10475993-Alexandrium_andersonii.AAC.1
MVTPPRSRGARRRRSPTTAAQHAQASASAGRHRCGMVTVTHPSSRLSPAASGGDHTAAAPPATACPSVRREEPSNVISGPLGQPRGPNSAASPTRIS